MMCLINFWFPELPCIVSERMIVNPLLFFSLKGLRRKGLKL